MLKHTLLGHCTHLQNGENVNRVASDLARYATLSDNSGKTAQGQALRGVIATIEGGNSLQASHELWQIARGL